MSDYDALTEIERAEVGLIEDHLPAIFGFEASELREPRHGDTLDAP